MTSGGEYAGPLAYWIEATIGIVVIGAVSILAYEGVRRLRAKRRAKAAADGGGGDAAAGPADQKE